jgi:nucleosome binding factor SPN SPT16 subunit
VQSGGVYDLKYNAEADDRNLHGGIILSIMGVKYKFYCAEVGRTYLIDPNKVR